jgi:ketosteroid isomerase-like protein
MDQTKFTDWLDAYKRAWETRDPEAAANLFTANANYHETPFEDPVRGREGIRDYWSDVTRYQEGIEFSYEVLAITETGGIAHWHSGFTRLTSNSAVELDGIFLVKLDADGKCTEFREWWHRIG